MSNDYIETLKDSFKEHKNLEISIGQAAYMKHHFEFYGLKSEVRRQLQKPFLDKDFLPIKENLQNIVETMWNLSQREFQYFGQELFFKYVKTFNEKDIVILEYMITHKSWWDTVDFIAVNLVGNYFKTFPQNRNATIKSWLESENIWLKRSAILFQLKYKNNTDTLFLSQVIQHNLGSKEFFINKAIGWALREYSKTNPEWVINFTDQHELNNLSCREALRLLKNR